MQWLFRFRTRLQWRGPRRYRTGFPLNARRLPLSGWRGRHRTVWSVKEILHGGGLGNDYLLFCGCTVTTGWPPCGGITLLVMPLPP